MNVNSAFSRPIAPQIPTPEKWNKIKHCDISYIFGNAEMFCLKNKNTRFSV